MLLPLLATITGIGIAIQASSNAVLLSHIKDNSMAVFMLFCLGCVFLLLILALNSTASGKLVFNTQLLKSAPAWSYFGGIIMASYLLSILFLIPKIGVANTLFFIVLGQIIGSLIIEHFALFGVQQKLMDMQKLLGAGLILVGVVLAKS